MNNAGETKIDPETHPEDEISLEELNSDSEEKSDTDILKKLRERLKKCEAEGKEYLAGWQRAKADYVNRERELQSAYTRASKMGEERVLRELFHALDSFDMAFANKGAWELVDKNWRHGVEYIYSQLLDILEQFGITPMNVLNEAFNPTKHESIGTSEIVEKEKDGQVIEVVSTGYVSKDGVVRPARIKVGNYKSN